MSASPGTTRTRPVAARASDRARGRARRHDDQRRALRDERRARVAPRDQGGRPLPLHQRARPGARHRELGARAVLPRHAVPEPATSSPIAGRQPVLLSASADRGYAATVELTNLEARTADGHMLPQASVHVRRTRFVADRLLRAAARAQLPPRARWSWSLDLHFDADFADLFEVRGQPPPPARHAAGAAGRGTAR